jgi:hypothetical protein
MRLYLINNLSEVYIQTSEDILMYVLKQAFLKHRWSFDHNLECLEINEKTTAKLIKQNYKEIPHLF